MSYYPISPLTWPGGKFRALLKIISRIPEFEEYREPFVGSGHVFFELRSSRSDKSYWINDLNPDLTCFYIWAKSHGARMAQDILQLKNKFGDGKDLLDYLMDLEGSGYNRALRFFVLNRITFYGIGVSRQHTKTKSFSLYKYERKFTEKMINRVATCENLLQNVKISNSDYSNLLQAPGENVFLFLDPPYKLEKGNDLYGKNGEFHRGFDFFRLSDELQACEHNWLMTVNDTPEMQDIFSWACIEPMEVKYSMGSVGTHSSRELYISNFRISNFKPNKMTIRLNAFMQG